MFAVVACKEGIEIMCCAMRGMKLKEDAFLRVNDKVYNTKNRVCLLKSLQ